MDKLNEHPQIAELMETLDKNGMQKEKTEVQSLVDYIGDMEQTLTGMLFELQNMRHEISLIHNSSRRAKCQSLIQKTDNKIRQGFVACKKMKDNLIRSATDAMKAFREKGKDALASSVRTMKIPEVIDKLAVMFRKLSRDISQDKVRLESMQSELLSAKGHLKNVGLIFVGRAPKKAEQTKSDKSALTRLGRLFDKVGKGFTAMEQKSMDAADKLRVSRVKDSVKTELQNLKSVTGGKTVSDPFRDR